MTLSFASRLQQIPSAFNLARFGIMATLIAFAGACQRERPADVSATVDRAKPTVLSDAHLLLANNNGKLHYEGIVADKATHAALTRTLDAAYGPAGLSGSLRIDASTAAAPWIGNLAPFLAAFTMPGAVVRFTGKRIELSGAVSDSDRIALRKKASALFPGYALTGLFEGIDETTIDTGADPSASPATANIATLLQQLNALPIAFEPESAVISPGSLDGLTKAARAIKGIPGKPRLQLGVHPELSDMPEYDIDLADQRARAVKIQLVINGVSPGAVQTTAYPIDTQNKARAGKVEFSELH